MLQFSVITLLPVRSYAALCQNIAIPAYSYPTLSSFWSDSIAAAPRVSIMIANTSNGPGSSADSNYVTVINQAKSAGVRVLGYVFTSYGARSAATVKADVDAWDTLYGVTDIFFDEISSSASDLAYYQDISDYVHNTSGAIVMLNPGVVPDEGYLQYGDIISVFEGNPAAYDSFSMPAWTNNYAASRFLHLIYAVSGQSAMTDVLTKSQNRRAGYVYITDDVLPNPWDVLPAYWSSEVSQMNQACTPSPSPAPSPPPAATPSPSPPATTQKSPTTPSETQPPSPPATTVPPDAEAPTPEANSSTSLPAAKPQLKTSPANKKTSFWPILVVTVSSVFTALIVAALLIRRHIRHRRHDLPPPQIIDGSHYPTA